MSRSGPVPVLLTAHSIGPGGGERQLALTALGLDRDRFAPHVLSLEGGFWEDRLRAAGVPLYRWPVASFIQPRSLIEAWRLRRRWLELGIRIVETFDFTMNLVAIPVARATPGVVSLASQRCHLQLVPRKYLGATRVLHRLAHGVVVNSSALAEEVTRECRVPRERLYVCPNGIDTATFSPEGRERIAVLAGATVVVGTVSVLRPEKNLPLLLRAFARASDPGWRLLIVGGGPEQEGLARLAGELGIVERCIFQGSVSNVVPFLRSIDLFVLPSRSEGLSNALMEAMSCGCLPLATDIPGSRELIRSGVEGLLFPNDDLEALTAALREVGSNAGLRARLVEASVSRICGAFSVEAALATRQQVYTALLAR
jgi:L-malate glycosyltransferase